MIGSLIMLLFLNLFTDHFLYVKEFIISSDLSNSSFFITCGMLSHFSFLRVHYNINKKEKNEDIKY